MGYPRFSQFAPAVLTILLNLLLYLPPTLGAVDVPWGLSGLSSIPRTDEIPNDLAQDSLSNRENLRAGESVLIEFNVDNCAVIQSFKSDSTNAGASRGARINNFVNRLQKHSQDAQAEVIDILTKKQQKYMVLWLETEIYVTNIDPAVKKDISDKFLGNKVKRIRQLETFAVSPPPDGTPYSYKPSDGTPKHIQQINRDCSETTCLGDGVRVAILDAGVDVNHPELSSRYLNENEYSWFDYPGGSPTPVDTQGRGTRVAGVALGTNIGVAKNAKWMACRAALETNFNELAMKLCAQWALCPTKYDSNWNEIPNTRKCERAPHVIIFAWGLSNYGQVRLPRSILYKSIEGWSTVGIFSSFAAGELGSSCTTVVTPAKLPVSFAVGAGDGTTKTVTAQSGRGPVLGFIDDEEIGTCASANEICEKHCDAGENVCSVIKPDLVAPGNDILTSVINSNRYELVSGTDVASGIVGGVAAIMVCAGKSWENMDQPLLVRRLRDSAFKDVNFDGTKLPDADTKNEVILWDMMCNKLFGKICGTLPNNLYGSGFVNACGAAKAMTRRVE